MPRQNKTQIMVKLFVCITLVNLCLCDYTPVIEIGQGKLRGQKSPLTGHYKYLSIPYAVSERFQSPQPPPRWRGTFYATNPLVVCPQNIIVPLGSENCTVLNVYTPSNARQTSGLPVMVFIHGGSFFYAAGSFAIFDPAYLVDHGVIVVTVNYRLGILGFLCLGIKGAAGNMGMKDQVAAFRWVQENIHAFGGNPDRVTIFGESAGAVSVHMHMMSKASKNLFQAVIIQSGSAIAPWGMNIDPINSARADAAKLGVTGGDLREVLDVFRRTPLDQLLRVTKDSVLRNTYKYSPCIESGLLEDEEPFLTNTPYNLLRTGSFRRIPVMMGMNSAEGIFFAGLHNFKTIEEMNRRFGDFVPRVFDWRSLKEKHEVESTIRHFYFGNYSISNAHIRRLIDFYSDTLTSTSLPKSVQIMTKFSNAPIYNYLFSYDGGRNFFKFFMGINVEGASHADDLFYIFNPTPLPLPISEEDKVIVNRMTKMWTNFAKTGNPTPERTQLLPVKWIPSVVNQTIYMNIDSEMFMIRQPFKKRIQFWEKLYSLYGMKGVAPAEVRRKFPGERWYRY